MTVDFLKPFRDVVSATGAVIESNFEDDFLSSMIILGLSIGFTIFAIRTMEKFVLGDCWSISDLFVRKKKDELSSDKADNMYIDENAETEQAVSPAREIQVYNVLLDRILFQYKGDYAKEEKRGQCTIYYTEDDEHKQFKFDVSEHIAVYEDDV